MSEQRDLTAAAARITARKRAFERSRSVLAAIDEGTRATQKPERKRRRPRKPVMVGLRERAVGLREQMVGCRERVRLVRPKSWFPLLCVLRRGVKHRVEDSGGLSRLAHCVFRYVFLGVMVPAAAVLFAVMNVAVLPVLLLSCVRLSERQAPTWFARVDGAASRELIVMTSPLMLAVVVALVRVTLV